MANDTNANGVPGVIDSLGPERAEGRRDAEQESEDSLPESLDDLAEQINQAHDRVLGNARLTLEAAAEAGRLLLRAKELCGHGEWLPWLERNCKVGSRQAQRYLALAKAHQAGKSDFATDLSIEAALRALSGPKVRAPSQEDRVANGDGARPAGEPSSTANGSHARSESDTIVAAADEDAQDGRGAELEPPVERAIEPGPGPRLPEAGAPDADEDTPADHGARPEPQDRQDLEPEPGPRPAPEPGPRHDLNLPAFRADEDRSEPELRMPDGFGNFLAVEHIPPQPGVDPRSLDRPLEGPKPKPTYAIMQIQLAFSHTLALIQALRNVDEGTVVACAPGCLPQDPPPPTIIVEGIRQLSKLLPAFRLRLVKIPGTPPGSPPGGVKPR